MHLQVNSFQVAATILYPVATRKKIAQNKEEINQYKNCPGMQFHIDELKHDNKIMQCILNLDINNIKHGLKIALIINAFLKEPYSLSVKDIMNSGVEKNWNEYDLIDAIEAYYQEIADEVNQAFKLL